MVGGAALRQVHKHLRGEDGDGEKPKDDESARTRERVGRQSQNRLADWMYGRNEKIDLGGMT